MLFEIDTLFFSPMVFGVLGIRPFSALIGAKTFVLRFNFMLFGCKTCCGVFGGIERGFGSRVTG